MTTHFVLGYFLCIIAFALWDSLIGMPIKWDKRMEDGPTMWLGAIFWWVSTPIAVVMAFSNFLSSVKERRETKEKEERLKKIRDEEMKYRIQLAAERELEESMTQLEVEMKTYSENKT